MLFLSSKERAEAKMRARDYAEYYLGLFGDQAVAQVDEKLGNRNLSQYRRELLRLTRKEIHRLLDLRNRYG